MFLEGWDINIEQISDSERLENHACNPNVICVASNDQRDQSLIKNDVRRGTLESPKMLKNPPWDLLGPLRFYVWPTLLQNGAKMVPKKLKMEPKWKSEDPEMVTG